MHHFEMFAGEHKNLVFVHEVFVVLALFCDGLESEKVDTNYNTNKAATDNSHTQYFPQIAFLFNLVDIGNKGWLSPTDLMLLLRCVTRAMCKIGITQRIPTDEQLRTLTQDCFV